MSPGPVLRFGAFELDRGTGGLRKHGLRVRMQEQPLRILTMLLERPGEIVTREELVKALWPDGTFVDSERSLNSAVTRLRQVLADSAENPRYVETMSRRGYRFIAPVEELTSAEPERAVAREAPKPAHWRNIMRLAWPVGVAVITVVAAVVYSARTPGDPFREPYTVLPLTRLPGNERDPSFSPDGREVVFAWDRGQNGPSDLYVKRIGDETLLPLTRSGGNDRSPAWSPDGRSIAFLRISPTRISVLLVPALPGPERTVAEMPRWNDADYIETVSYLGWSADGKWLVIPNHESLADRVGLSAIAPETGEMRALTRPPKEWIGDFSPALSPDARRLSFVRLAGIEPVICTRLP